MVLAPCLLFVYCFILVLHRFVYGAGFCSHGCAYGAGWLFFLLPMMLPRLFHCFVYGCGLVFTVSSVMFPWCVHCCVYGLASCLIALFMGLALYSLFCLVLHCFAYCLNLFSLLGLALQTHGNTQTPTKSKTKQ